MKNSIVLGITAGAVALVASALIVRKLNLIDKILCKTEGLTGKLSDYCDLIPKGEQRNVNEKFK